VCLAFIIVLSLLLLLHLGFRIADFRYARNQRKKHLESLANEAKAAMLRGEDAQVWPCGCSRIRRGDWTTFAECDSWKCYSRRDY
jgi:hypothetical protein